MGGDDEPGDDHRAYRVGRGNRGGVGCVAGFGGASEASAVRWESERSGVSLDRIVGEGGAADGLRERHRRAGDDGAEIRSTHGLGDSGFR
jgi:hypothetical protein